MESAIWIGGLVGLILVLAYLFWRYYWFLRNPKRLPPPGEGLLSPADGTVVYAHRIEPGQPAVSIKKGLQATIKDISSQDLAGPLFQIGVFMSPFDVHYNRSPLTGKVEFVRHYPAKPVNLNMAAMHCRVIFQWPPLFKNSRHIVQNERTVTKILGRLRGRDLGTYIVQIAGKTVRGIEVLVSEGAMIERGQVFGLIRIGSQVDLFVPCLESLAIKVKEGDKVKAGQSVLIDFLTTDNSFNQNPKGDGMNEGFSGGYTLSVTD